ncbi:hypothetical protein PG994_012628 [Apiospora phragmitis]|uniref:Uncharacterized protein n=1 Tax=Apiospora phragmitis TaxID=2905665 RepID=A0ABR1TCU9_9PEZI
MSNAAPATPTTASAMSEAASAKSAAPLRVPNSVASPSASVGLKALLQTWWFPPLIAVQTVTSATIVLYGVIQLQKEVSLLMTGCPYPGWPLLLTVFIVSSAMRIEDDSSQDESQDDLSQDVSLLTAERD